MLRIIHLFSVFQINLTTIRFSNRLNLKYIRNIIINIKLIIRNLIILA